MSRFLSLLAAKVDRTAIGYEGGVEDPNGALTAILNLVYAWGAIIAVLVIVIAGYFLVTARGEPAQIKRGKDALRGALIGLVVILLAFVITSFILGRF